MENKDIFMVNTKYILLDGFNNDMASLIGGYSYCGYEELLTPLYIPIPFKKTNNNNRDEYVELISGTLFHKEEDTFYTEDKLVHFKDVCTEEYTDEKMGKLYENHIMFFVKRHMKSYYNSNKRLCKKHYEDSATVGAKKLSKRIKKFKNKIENNK